MSDSFATPRTVAPQAPLSVGFPKQEYWSWLPFHPPGHLPDPGIKLTSPALASGFFTPQPPGKLILSIHSRVTNSFILKMAFENQEETLEKIILFMVLFIVVISGPLSSAWVLQKYLSVEDCVLELTLRMF